MRGSIGMGVVLVAGLSAALAPAPVAKADDFFRSREITIMVGSDPGGGYDGYARLFARFMPRYIAGTPVMVVRNMPGAGGIRSANFIYNVAPKDGTTIGILDRGIPTAPLLYGEASKAQFDGTRFAWIGSAMRESGMGVVSSRSPAHSIEEAKHVDVMLGSNGAESDPAMYPRLLNALIGTRFKIINGYKGQPEMFNAVEKDELHGLFMSGWSGPGRDHVLKWVGEGKALLLVQMSLKRDPAIPDNVPMVMDLLGSEDDRRIIEMVLARLELGRPFVGPPDTLSDRVETLRAAFRKATEDPELLADARRQKYVINPIYGADAEELIARLYATSPEALERMRRISKPDDTAPSVP
jgi:tripartite-type tricarboxylate transporter receptor subunit TctC